MIPPSDIPIVVIAILTGALMNVIVQHLHPNEPKSATNVRIPSCGISKEIERRAIDIEREIAETPTTDAAQRTKLATELQATLAAYEQARTTEQAA